DRHVIYDYVFCFLADHHIYSFYLFIYFFFLCYFCLFFFCYFIMFLFYFFFFIFFFLFFFFFFQAEDGIRDLTVTGVQTCALPISISLLKSAHLAAQISTAKLLLDDRCNSCRQWQFALAVSAPEIGRASCRERV